jgi:hypothetical protein
MVDLFHSQYLGFFQDLQGHVAVVSLFFREPHSAERA